jgi:hypothetical protein
MILLFLFHPSHIEARPLIGPFTLSQIVHATAIVASPLLLFGMWEMCRSNWFDNSAARLGLTAAALATALTVNAAVVSSFVTPVAAIAGAGAMPFEMRSGGHNQAFSIPPLKTHQPIHVVSRAELPPLVQVTVSLNRGLAQAHVALLSLALLLFGGVLWSRSHVLAVTGMVVGAAPLVWQLSGSFSPETYTMPFVVIPQSAWLIAVAIAITRSEQINGAET